VSEVLNNPPTISRAGRTYPVKFQIRDENGTLVTSLAAVSSIRSKAVSCGSFSGYTSDALNTTTATGDTSMRFEDDQFVYDWKTPSSAGCYELFVTLADGGSTAPTSRSSDRSGRRIAQSPRAAIPAPGDSAPTARAAARRSRRC
jgi:hypothetical protein